MIYVEKFHELEYLKHYPYIPCQWIKKNEDETSAFSSSPVQAISLWCESQVIMFWFSSDFTLFTGCLDEVTDFLHF